mgnify:CR=1 FL=1
MPQLGGTGRAAPHRAPLAAPKEPASLPDSLPLLAVLIDADNTSPKHAGAIFEEIASFGEASVRRAYGDFSSQQMSGWSKVQSEHGIVPLHSPAYTVGKNSSDISLVIDAMDLLHAGRFDGFVLVSSSASSSWRTSAAPRRPPSPPPRASPPPLRLRPSPLPHPPPPRPP